MARTTKELVRDIMDDVVLDDVILDSYIESANTFVTSALGKKGMGETVLSEIERWVTAHMIASTRDRQIKKAGAGGAEVEYTGKWGEGLNGTSYGQMAVTLDTSRTLSAMAQGKLAAWTYVVPTRHKF